MQDYKLFTWNTERFPNPSKTIADLQAHNIKTTVIIDPGIKIEKGYLPYEDGIKKNLFIKYTDGKEYAGEVWPGWCHFVDFTCVDGRAWWKQWFQQHVTDGVAGFWNDMNEIATWGQYLPNNLVFDYEGYGATSLLGRNVFGLLMARATFEAAQHWSKERNFVLTRSAYAGIQRYAALWTGDNIATDEHMMLGIRMLQSIGMSGVAFCGFDVGGFAGNTTPELFTRWISIATFTPFFRTHAMVNSTTADPWSFGEEALEIARNYISLRYRLLPYIYSTFYQAHRTGMPVMRSLAIAFTHCPVIYKNQFQHQFLLGDSFLIVPVKSDQNLTETYLPKGKWYDFYNDTIYLGEQTIYVSAPLKRLPVFIKEGAIIPMQSQTQSTQEMPQQTLWIHLYFTRGESHFEYYEDDGASHTYTKGEYYKRLIQWKGKQQKLIFGQVEGKYNSHFKTITLLFHQFDPIKTVLFENQKYKVSQEEAHFMQPISNFDPFLYQRNSRDASFTIC